MSAPNQVNFWSPQAMIAPDLSVEQQQVDRQQQLAMALRQQSLQNDVPQRGAYSWTQGAAKIAQALAASRLQAKADQQQAGLNRRSSAAMAGMFGVQPASSPQGGAVPALAPQPAPQTAPQSASQAAPPTDDLLKSFDAAFPASQQQQAPDPTPAPQQQSPWQPQQAQQLLAQPQRGAWSLSGNPQQDMAAYMLNPEKYGEAVIASHAPTDYAKMLMQAGIDPSSPLGHQLIQAQIAKQNYITPTNARGNSWTIDPNTGQRTYNPSLPEGSEPLYDSYGKLSGVRTIDGAIKSIRDIESAKAGGEADYKFTQILGADGNYHWVSNSSLAGDGSGRGGGTGGGGTGGGGTGGNQTPAGKPSGGGNIAGLGPGKTSATTQAGSNSANAFSAAVEAGQFGKDDIRKIQTILDAAKDLPTGALAPEISRVKSGWNAVLGAVPFASHVPDFVKADPKSIANFDVIAKNAAQLAQSMSSSGASGTTDARLHNALSAVVSGDKSPGAITELGNAMMAKRTADIGFSQAAARWQTTHGAETFPDFQREWQKAYDPDVFYYMQKGVPAFNKWVDQMSDYAARRVRAKYLQLRTLGAFDQ